MTPQRIGRAKARTHLSKISPAWEFLKLNQHSSKLVNLKLRRLETGFSPFRLPFLATRRLGCKQENDIFALFWGDFRAGEAPPGAWSDRRFAKGQTGCGSIGFLASNDSWPLADSGPTNGQPLEVFIRFAHPVGSCDAAQRFVRPQM